MKFALYTSRAVFSMSPWEPGSWNCTPVSRGHSNPLRRRLGRTKNWLQGKATTSKPDQHKRQPTSPAPPCGSARTTRRQLVVHLHEFRVVACDISPVTNNHPLHHFPPVCCVRLVLPQFVATLTTSTTRLRNCSNLTRFPLHGGRGYQAQSQCRLTDAPNVVGSELVEAGDGRTRHGVPHGCRVGRIDTARRRHRHTHTPSVVGHAPVCIHCLSNTIPSSPPSQPRAHPLRATLRRDAKGDVAASQTHTDMKQSIYALKRPLSSSAAVLV
jgi:hypothetical protein